MTLDTVAIPTPAFNATSLILLYGYYISTLWKCFHKKNRIATILNFEWFLMPQQGLLLQFFGSYQ
jgi:hypothetical protein